MYRFQRTFEIASCGVSISGVGGFRRLARWADIIHYHFPWPFGDFLHVVGQISRPSVVTYHSDIVRQRTLKAFYSPLMRHFLGSVNSIVATSPNYFATSDVLSRYAEKVEVIPIGLERRTHPEVSAQTLGAMRARVGEGFFLFVGMLRYYKGLHILLDAIHGTSLRAVIAGAGPIEGELRAHARSLGLANVHFLGSVSDEEKLALIHLSRAIVFPSYLRAEAFGVTLLEGAMYGKPLISTEIGTGTSYVNIDGQTGYVVPPADRKRLRDAMLKLDGDHMLARRMGKAAEERYERLFTGRQMGGKYAELYDRVANHQTLPSRYATPPHSGEERRSATASAGYYQGPERRSSGRATAQPVRLR